ncbi:tRNA wybutosine-synthesizing protein 2/3/4-like [Thalassophryne amazonica]|uniref:tRNA wybutosine-synthesizing protein 2/3/4-like n=1 Tax=Thalassophryne amazonica TaxID=390379 RepID=UPI0014711964|nr:tRNA wybutosine-synthesizing protein 2/3/4-like [Thalassophryne amazonica]
MPDMSQISSCLWTQLPQSLQSPCDRFKHACCSYSGSVYILGGRQTSSLRDFWKYSVVCNEWTELDCTGEAAPEELEDHSMVAHEGFLYVFGGMLDSAYSKWRCPLWVFDIAKQKWLHWQGKMTSSQHQMPTNRKGHSAVVLGSKMLVYGGLIDIRGSSQEFWALEFDTMDWSLTDGSQQGSLGPGPRHSHSAVSYQDCMYLFGGLQGLREQRDLWRWNSTNHTWSCLKTSLVLLDWLDTQLSPIRTVCLSLEEAKAKLPKELLMEVQLPHADLGAGCYTQWFEASTKNSPRCTGLGPSYRPITPSSSCAPAQDSGASCWRRSSGPSRTSASQHHLNIWGQSAI